MAVKKRISGKQPSAIQFGGGISAVKALPRAKGKRPAVILLHERYGVDQHTKDLTVKLARSGFVGFAPDLFHRYPGDRGEVLKGNARVDLRDDEVMADLNAAVDYLKRQNAVDGAKIAIIGVCQTGRQAMLLAANRDDIAAAVVLYGAIGGKEWLANEARPKPIEELTARCGSPILGVFGEKDHIISIDDVRRFRDCLEKNRKNYHIRIYRDAPHGWLNDTMPGRYRKEAAKDAWDLIISFLKKSFSGAWAKDRIVWKFENDYSTQYDFTTNVRME
jgi:carboxymethylenebutenolidase